MKERLLKHAEMIRKGRRGKHDLTVDKLVMRLRHEKDYQADSLFDKVAKEIEFFRPHKEYMTAGEIDVYACRERTRSDSYLLLFEVKSFNSTKNRLKAYSQLDREEQVLAEPGERVFKFYVTPGRIEWYRK